MSLLLEKKENVVIKCVLVSVWPQQKNSGRSLFHLCHLHVEGSPDALPQFTTGFS